MAALQKLQLVVALLSLTIASSLVLPAAAQEVGSGGTVDPGATAASPLPPAPADGEAKGADPDRLETLFAELAEPGRTDWEKLEAEIGNIWSRSGSPSMDLLLRRGNEDMQAEDYPAAVEHFSALIDHAPGFAEAWNARATAYFLEGDFSLAMADIEHVLVLNPRHFGALTGLASMFEAMDQPREALAALRMAEKINPNRPSIRDAISRLEKQTGEVDL